MIKSEYGFHRACWVEPDVVNMDNGSDWESEMKKQGWYLAADMIAPEPGLGVNLWINDAADRASWPLCIDFPVVPDVYSMIIYLRDWADYVDIMARLSAIVAFDSLVPDVRNIRK